MALHERLTIPMALHERLSSYWSCFQALLLPQLEETLGVLGGTPSALRHGARMGAGGNAAAVPVPASRLSAKRPRRLERQHDMTLAEMLADLPRHCDIGAKRDAKGYQLVMERLQVAY